jgi:hypothetical protein
VKGEKLFAVMALSRCRAMLRAVLLLARNDMMFVAAGLVRSIFEFAATGTWLLEGGEHLDLFLGDFVLKHGRLVRERSDVFDHNNAWDALLETIADAEIKRLPPIIDRLSPELREHYLWYRDLCARDHCGLTSICQTATEVDGDTYVTDAAPTWGAEQKLLGYAAMMTFHLAFKTAVACDFENEVELVNLSFRINSLMRQWGPANPAGRTS